CLAHGVNAGEQALHLPLRGVIGEDEFLGLGAVDDVSDPVIEARSSAPCHGEAAAPHALLSLDLREWLPARLHAFSSPHLKSAPHVGCAARNARAGHKVR